MRKAPAAHAKEYDLGATARGNDGNTWVIIQTKKGVKRWKRTALRRRKTRGRQSRKSRRRTKSKKKGQKNGPIYFTHDNGGRPFKVVISGKNISVYKLPSSWSYDEEARAGDYTDFIKTFKNVKKIFIGKDRKLGKKFDGNSILLKLSNNKYVFIGHSIYEFLTKDDIIVKYFSQVGNNDVPYPVALGEKNVYFMLEGDGMGVGPSRPGVVPRSVFPNDVDWKNAYNLFYGLQGNQPLKNYAKRFSKVKIIHKRR